MVLLIVIVLLSISVLAGAYIVFKDIEDYEEDIVYSRAKIEFIKNKYRKIDNIKKIKQATKEDVERFYEEQKNKTF